MERRSVVGSRGSLKPMDASAGESPSIQGSFVFDAGDPRNQANEEDDPTEHPPELVGMFGETIDPTLLDGMSALEMEPVTEPVMTKIQGSAHEGTGTSISSQIQKIIARELGAPSKKGRIDLQSVPMKEYLEQTVIPIIHQALLALARERPASPIEYLAAFFLKHKQKYMTDLEQQTFFNAEADQAQDKSQIYDGAPNDVSNSQQATHSFAFPPEPVQQ